MNKTITILLLALIAFSTTSVTAGDRPPLPKNTPKWLVKDMKKESRKKKLHSVKFANDAIEVQVTGKLREAPEEVNPGVWYIFSNFGGDVDVNCWVITEPRYLFDSLLSTANGLLESTAQQNNNGKIISNEVHYTEVGFMKGIPHAVLERVFLIETENDEQLVGLQKARSAQRDGVTFVCDHTELGYFKTFEKMFTNFVVNAKIETTLDKSYYKEQQLISLNDKPVGFAQASMTLDADGDTMVATQTGMMLSLNKDSLSVIDSRSIEYSYPDGRLINAISSSVKDDKFTHDLQIARNEEDSWVIEGTEADKEVRYIIDQEAVPLSMLGQIFQSKEAVKQEVPGTSELLIWSPDINTATLTTATLTTGKSKRGKTEAVSVMGPIKSSLILDASGSTISSLTEISGASLTSKRVNLEGAVRSPENY